MHTQWAGSSTATPTFEPAQVHKATKHAIESAKATEDIPVLTAYADPGHQRNKQPWVLQPDTLK